MKFSNAKYFEKTKTGNAKKLSKLIKKLRIVLKKKNVISSELLDECQESLRKRTIKT